MIIGLDVGGTNIKGVLMKGTKVIVKIKTEIKSRNDRNVLLAQIFDCINNLRLGKKIEKIGIGVAGPVDFERQMVLNPPNLVALKNLKLGKIITEKFKTKAIIEHDADCFVLAEAILGAGKNYKSVFGITLGTGVGGGLAINKKIYHGAHGSAGEIGHTTIEKNGRQCACGNKGCLEAYINDKGIKQTAQEIFKKRIDRMRTFDDLAEKKDRRAIKLYEIVGKYLGIGLANLVDMVSPDIIIVGGGIMRAGKFILEPARKEMKKNILSSGAKKTKLLKSKIGKFAGAIGASLLTF